MFILAKIIRECVFRTCVTDCVCPRTLVLPYQLQALACPRCRKRTQTASTQTSVQVDIQSQTEQGESEDGEI